MTVVLILFKYKKTHLISLIPYTLYIPAYTYSTFVLEYESEIIFEIHLEIFIFHTIWQFYPIISKNQLYAYFRTEVVSTFTSTSV